MSKIPPGGAVVTRWITHRACLRFRGHAIYTMRADGTDVVNVKPLAPGTSFISAPLWSPDGRSLAFSHNDGTQDVFIMNSTSGNEVRITNDTRLDTVTYWQRRNASAGI